MRRNSYNIDSLIESETGRTVVEWFEMGEPKFREIETLVLKQTTDFNDAIIATGGGTACYHDNMVWMKENGMQHVGGVYSTVACTRVLYAGGTCSEVENIVMDCIRDCIKSSCRYARGTGDSVGDLPLLHLIVVRCHGP